MNNGQDFAGAILSLIFLAGVAGIGALIATFTYESILNRRAKKKLHVQLLALANFERPFTIEQAATITGAPAEMVKQAAELLVKSGALVQDPQSGHLMRRSDNQLY